MKKHIPIPAAKVAAGKVRLSQLSVSENKIYWLESRPEDKGRTGIKCWSQNRIIDLLPKDFSCHSKVHEYGGGAYCIVNGDAFFVNAKDQQVYVLVEGQSPRQLTLKPDQRYADIAYCGNWNALIAVCEDHDPVSTFGETKIEGEPDNYLVAIDCETGHVEPIVKGADFYSSPRVSPDGEKLLWLDWNHPNMPWDHSKLWIADIQEKYELDNPERIAGNEVEAVVQPEWFGENIRFNTDRSGWWNVYEFSAETGSTIQLYSDEKEYARAPWVFGLSNYASLDDGRMIGFTESNGEHQLYLLDPVAQTKKNLLPQFNNVESIVAAGNDVYLIAGSAASNQSVWFYDITSEKLTALSSIPDSEFVISRAQSISFPTSHEQMAHANLYLPDSVSSDLPPLMVKCHGGPSGVALKGLDWKIQFWTSRGFAVLDVNYRGSTGFGREYRNSLYGHWGEYDVDDCLAGIEYLIERKLVDPEKIVITGGSAGGYTVLRSLIVSNLFAAGTSYYGVADLKTLVGDDHKFESRYLETCIAPLATHPERYDELSPINHIDQINNPMLFFQGLKDRVVPPHQTTSVVAALKKKGNRVELVEFPEEAHGFRRAESIIRSLETEYGFYREVFGN
ncbi:MAG: S9 family peptidase [Gammaproteobacteria bacterium]|nr:prolyl oligopeptidase family serine peptidase [Gammaproteobacteria bacterium]NNC97954.1 S9 family peptidase [Gammaproteobacteria bacterium]NNM13783.1 S9 family peptidase [Gammaproteobacteria bacterium]